MNRDQLAGAILIVSLTINVAMTLGEELCDPYVYEFLKDENPPIDNGLRYNCNLNSLTSSLNFSMIPADRTLELIIQCKQTKDGTLRPCQFAHLSQLLRLRIWSCNVKTMPADALFGLDNLKLLQVTTTTTTTQDHPSSATALAPNLLKHVPELDILDLSFLGLDATACNFLCPVLDLVFLKLDGNKFANVTNVGCGPDNLCCRNLKKLQLSNNAIRRISVDDLRSMNQMATLDFGSNSIERIDEGSLDAMTLLEFVDFRSNRLSALPDGLFDSNKLLQKIILSDNLIHNLADDLLKGLDKLDTLTISDNAITALAPTAFEDLRSLKNLDISNNLIRIVPPDLFAGLTNVLILSMSANAFASLENTGVNYLLQLTYLDLSRNNLRNISGDYFAHLTALQMLDLSDNRIPTPPSFRTLTNLTLLNLAGNGIDRFENGLELGESVREVHLDNNTLDGVSLQELTMSFVQHLYLNRTKLKSLSGLIECCSSLTELYVDYNDVGHLGKDLKHLSKLVHFNASHNVLAGNLDFALRIPHSLQELDVSHNLLTSLSNTFGDPQAYELKSLYASFNGIQYVKSTVLPAKLKTVDLSNNDIMALEPFVFSSMNSLAFLKLSHNSISKSNSTWFAFNQPLSVDLTHNDLECDCSNSWLLNPQYNFVSKTGYCTVTHQRTKRFKIKLDFANATADQLLCVYKPQEHDERCVPNCTCYYTSDRTVFEVDCGGRRGGWNFERFPTSTTRLFLDGVRSVPFSAINASVPYANLTLLFLNGSRVSTLPDDAFRAVPNVVKLYLQNNVLREVLAPTFKRLQKLQYLYLHGNRLHSVGNLMFPSLTSLRFITLHSNDFDNLAGANYSRTVRALTLSSNPFQCTCDYIPALQEWVFERGVNILDADNTYCTNRHNASVPILAFNESTCSQVPETVPLDGNLMPMLVTAGICLSLFVLLAGAYLFREELLVYLYARFGIRIFYRNREARAEKAYDAYVCYSYQDEDFVANQLVPGLKRYRLCLHERDFPVGGFIVESVIEAVQRSCRTILVLSPNFVRSEWCRFEFMTAHQQALKDRCCRLIVVILKDVPESDMEPQLQLYLRTNTYLCWGHKQFWDKLRFALPQLENEITKKPPQPQDCKV